MNPIQRKITGALVQAALREAQAAGPADGVAIEVAEDLTALRLRFVQGEDEGGGVYAVFDWPAARALLVALTTAVDMIDPLAPRFAIPDNIDPNEVRNAPGSIEAFP